MVHPVCPFDRLVILGMRARNTSQIDTTLAWVGPPAVVCVNAASLAKVMLRGAGSPSIKRKIVRALGHHNRRRIRRHSRRLPAGAERTRAATNIVKPMGERRAQFNRTTMAACRDLHWPAHLRLIRGIRLSSVS